MVVRREAFTDECFAGCPRVSVSGILGFVTMFSIVKALDFVL